jgi:chaperonin GroES
MKGTVRMTLTPLGDRLVVRTLEADDVTTTGIVLPDTAQEKPQRGEVLAVGPGRLDEGERIPVDLVVGDKVIFAKYGGTEVRVDGEDLLILRESDVLAKEV